ncbi:MAG: GTPase ObgE [Flavobacteriales bacterium]|nr:GTPase ObgE [Flavobacteriales bacterium]|tara:strand:- start:649 stop:1647 length:999 start_codon:yes stop_codon:yes gene_type:complete
MTEGNFVDYVKVHLSSGNGGKGSIHLHREKFITKGGPDGGDGGRGGHIIVRANSQLWTLYNFKYKRHFSAGHGENGSKNRSSGAKGQDIFIEVPVGTIIKNFNGDTLFEFIEDSQESIILEGGLGGRGNWHFKSSTRQTPRYAQPGKKGKLLDVIFELKVLADVGLVGHPNVGKSTLLASITDAKPKIADYEFTTLKPNIGIVPYHDFRSFIMADIPGIIKGASSGKGLGHYFLRHIERNSILLFMIPSDTNDLKKEFEVLISELREYNSELLDKNFAVALTKCDLLDNELIDEYEREMELIFKNIPFFMISSISTMGLNKLKDGLWKLLNN